MEEKPTEPEDDLRPHYDFDYSKMKPNRFAGMDLKFKGRRVQTATQKTDNATVRSKRRT